MTREEELTHYLNNIDFENDDVVYNEIEKLFKKNQELKQKLNWIAFGDDPELALRYLRKIGYVDFDEERKVYINKHNNEPFVLDDEEEKAYYIKSEELNEYTEQLEYQNNELKKQLENYQKLGFKYLQDQNIELNKRYLNAVADYETTMAEKVELERQLKELGGVDEYNRYLLNQQKEFIRWLDGNTRLAPEPKKGLLNEILQKYKEIIGVSDEKK